MEPFIEKLRQVLRTEFAGSQDELEPRASRKVGGFLVWDGFSGLEQIERQHRVWNVLKSRLNLEDQRRITAVLTLRRAQVRLPSATPAEWSAMTEKVGIDVKAQTGTASEQFQATGDNYA